MPEKNTEPIRRINGSCHCGNIRFVFHRPGIDDEIPVRACGCTFCVKHHGVWTSHPEGRIELSQEDPSQVQRYRFGTETADFYICATCGVSPIVTSEIDGARYAVVNVHCFDDVDPSELVESATDFDGETTDDRLARRQRNWAPLVSAG
ncbi:MAG: hypothetical protein GKS02_00255 [Alphaproteobacteria bacterium]|nr:hypothetical protein [Alphaproteobacteria bacterium]